MDALRETYRLATSKTTKRAVLNTVLLTTGAATLLGLAAIASGLFFHNFVPRQVVTKPVYLQYGSGPNPFALVSLSSPPLKPAQDYDISVSLLIPRSQANLDRGNFMVSLHLLDLDVSPALHGAAKRFADDHDHFDGHSSLFSSRRPALTPYEDPLVSLASRVLFLFYYMLFPGSQKHELSIGLAERVSFAKGNAVPASAYIEVEAGQSLQTYQATLTLTAQLRGLRWLMFHYRLPTYIFFTFLFWACEVLFMGAAWSLWSMSSAPERASLEYSGEREKSDWVAEYARKGRENPSGRRSPRMLDLDVKDEEEDDEIKEEEARQTRSLSELPLAGAEADDEYEGDDVGGVGTGSNYSQQRGRDVANVRRRASHDTST